MRTTASRSANWWALSATTMNSAPCSPRPSRPTGCCCSPMSTDSTFPTVAKRPSCVRTVRKLTPAMEDLCNGKGKLGTGGMRSKLRAAKAGQRIGRARRHRQRTPSPRHRVGACSARSAPISPLRKSVADMATSVQSQHLDSRKARTAPAPPRPAWRSYSLPRRIACCWRWPTRLKRRCRSILEANQKDLDSGGAHGRHARPPAADAGANRRHGCGRARDCRPARSHRRNHCRVEAPQRLAYPQSARAAGRGRHHLRVAPQRDGRYASRSR